MNNFLTNEFSIASMEGGSLQNKIVSLNINRKTDIGLERGGQANFSIETHLILKQFYKTN